MFYYFQGRHCCLFCCATREEIQMDKENRLSTIRTLETLDNDHRKFLESGGNLKNVKNFNNVIEQRIFNVPLNQVNDESSQCF